MERIRKTEPLVKLFLDSGAYSAWSRDEAIDLKKYIAYIQENKKYIWHYVSLDVIPGKFNDSMSRGSQSNIKLASDASYKNHQQMKDAGLEPIPVFHQGEELSVLERYLKDGDRYIGISANKFVRVDAQLEWLRGVFNILTNKEGVPYVRTHGFALTAFRLFTLFPWYTVDSTTWSLTPGYGQIIIPAYINGKFDYLHEPERIAISGVMHQSASSQKKQFENFALQGKFYKKTVEKFLHEVVGTTIHEIRYGTNERRRAMLIYYLNLCKALKGTRFNGHRARIFGPDHYDTGKLTPLPPFTPILTFATSLNREWSELLTEVGANHRLLSYYELRDRGSDVVKRYVTTGSNGKYKKARIRPTWDETYLNRRKLALIKRVQAYAKQEGTGEQARTRRPRVGRE